MEPGVAKPAQIKFYWSHSHGCVWLEILHLHLSHLADALIQSDLQIGAFTL
jgi:hypothetical protein